MGSSTSRSLSLPQAARDRFKAYIKSAQQEKEDRKAAALHLKRMVQFNALVVTPVGGVCARSGVAASLVRTYLHSL